LLPCGFAFDRPTARHGPRCSRPLSPIAPTTRHGWPCGSPDWSSRDDGSLGSLGRRAWRVTALVCVARSRIGPGSPDSAAGTPASKPCSPRESVLATTRPWPGMVGRLGRCSPGPFPSKACSSNPWVRFLRANVRGRVRTRASCALECQRTLATSIARSKHRPWGLEPMVRRRERSISTAARLPSGSDPADARFREALARQSPASSPAAALVSSRPRRLPRIETCCPRPLSAAPRTSRALCRTPPCGRARVDLGDARFGLPVGRPLPGTTSSCGVLPLVEDTRECELR
jgi:hypothetical protein